VCFPGAYRAQGPKGLSVAAGHRPGAFHFKIIRVFELMPLTSAPVGFEPALTAPEANAV